MFRGSPVEVATHIDISENFTLASTVYDASETVELVFSGGTDVMLSFSRRGFEQFKAQWADVVAKADARFEDHHIE
ncbi:hypothetical protein ACQPZF_17725 [Actinosynnema sp. CS-041913]|uniref:hypothetical protein n=1 Tax=Actinosynnema sp. CS-041913 TaxID=3239917 RepID=UPI003D8D83EC